jgi:hypothetical protein
MAHCMDLDPSVNLEGIEAAKNKKVVETASGTEDDNFQHPELGSVLEPGANCDGFTKHSIKGTSANSEADTAPELKIQVPANYQSSRNQGYEYQLRNENM